MNEGALLGEADDERKNQVTRSSYRPKTDHSERTPAEMSEGYDAYLGLDTICSASVRR